MNPASSKPSATASEGQLAAADGAACSVDASDGIPTCDTGPAGRYAFVFREIVGMFRGRRRNRGDDVRE